MTGEVICYAPRRLGVAGIALLRLLHRDGLGQVARLVHIAAAAGCQVVGEESEGDSSADGLQDRFRLLGDLLQHEVLAVATRH